MDTRIRYSNGLDIFKDNLFSYEDWSAPTVIRAWDVRELINSFSLKKRRIKNMRFVGRVFNMEREGIEDYAYDHLDFLEEDERAKASEYSNIDPAMRFQRYATIDEPFMIEFEDGDVFEIVTINQPEFMMSMNRIPWDIESSQIEETNVDANDFFRSCIGRRIMFIETKTHLTHGNPYSYAPYDRAMEVVWKLILWLDDSSKICIESYQGFCYVSLMDPNNEVCYIKFEALKEILNNAEDRESKLGKLFGQIGLGWRDIKDTIGEWFSGIMEEP